MTREKVQLKVYLNDILQRFQTITNKVTTWQNTPTDTNYPSEKLVKDSLDNKLDKTSTDTGFVKTNGDTTTFGTGATQVATGNHTHGNLTTDGKVGSNSNYFVTTTTNGAITSKQKIGNINTSGQIGTTANKPLITTTSGAITTGSFGTAANTFCQGNDSRLSDARTPTSHTHGNLTNDGKIGTTANKPVITGTSGVITTGSFGTSANTFCQGNDSRLSDARTPLAHTHDLDDITDYIVTSISCSDYNPTIDGTVTVTVFVGDSEGVGIQGVSVPVTASEGQFTKLNNTTITASSSVTGITGANGTFTLTYACSEWGLVTFSANNKSAHCRVKGYKSESIGGNSTLYYNDEEVYVELKYSSSTTYNTNGDWYDFTIFSTIPTNLTPNTYVSSIIGNNNMNIRVNTSGVIQYHTTATVSSPYIAAVLHWKRK